MWTTCGSPNNWSLTGKNGTFPKMTGLRSKNGRVSFKAKGRMVRAGEGQGGEGVQEEGEYQTWEEKEWDWEAWKEAKEEGVERKDWKRKGKACYVKGWL